MRQWPSLAAGLVAALLLAVVEAGMVVGPVRPVVMVALTLAVGAVIGAIWGWRRWPAAIMAGASVPLRHFVIRLLGLPDTTQPNTFDAVLMMGIFSLAVSAAGFCAGVLMRQAVSDGDV